MGQLAGSLNEWKLELQRWENEARSARRDASRESVETVDALFRLKCQSTPTCISQILVDSGARFSLATPGKLASLPKLQNIRLSLVLEM